LAFQTCVYHTLIRLTPPLLTLSIVLLLYYSKLTLHYWGTPLSWGAGTTLLIVEDRTAREDFLERMLQDD
jgi:hypothetical protein